MYFSVSSLHLPAFNTSLRGQSIRHFLCNCNHPLPCVRLGRGGWEALFGNLGMFKSCVVTEKIREKSRICSSSRFHRLSRHYRDPPDLSSFIESSKSISHSALTFANLFSNTTDETLRRCSYTRGNLLANCSSAAISTETASFIERARVILARSLLRLNISKLRDEDHPGALAKVNQESFDVSVPPIRARVWLLFCVKNSALLAEETRGSSSLHFSSFFRRAVSRALCGIVPAPVKLSVNGNKETCGEVYFLSCVARKPTKICQSRGGASSREYFSLQEDRTKV